MSCSLPPEILDFIADYLHDELAALKTCCVVSKSWVPRTRKHLFAHVEFHTVNSPVQLWKKAFPDPSNSPARHTSSLSFRGFPVVAAADADVGGWIHTFNRVIHLRLECLHEEDHRVSLIPFHGLSPAIRSLYLACTHPAVFDLICSFPLLEDLAFEPFVDMSDNHGWNAPPTSPKLTGSLDLGIPKGGHNHSTVRRLLGFPDGLRFAKITVWCFTVTDVESAMDLVSRCSDTLESLSVGYYISDTSRTPPPLDLSKATKLKDVQFWCRGQNIQRITTALRTAVFKSLQQITIRTDDTTLMIPIREMIHQESQDLDRLLAQLWTSYSIRPKVTFETIKRRSAPRDLAQSLLPELTRRGVVDVIEYG